jgi:hypothetical protein
MTYLEVIEQAETALGENLVWIADQVDIKIRQKDTETLRKLAQLNLAWQACAQACAQAMRASKSSMEKEN